MRWRHQSRIADRRPTRRQRRTRKTESSRDHPHQRASILVVNIYAAAIRVGSRRRRCLSLRSTGSTSTKTVPPWDRLTAAARLSVVRRRCANDVLRAVVAGTGVRASAGVRRRDVDRSSSSSKQTRRGWWRRSMFSCVPGFSGRRERAKSVVKSRGAPRHAAAAGANWTEWCPITKLFPGGRANKHYRDAAGADRSFAPLRQQRLRNRCCHSNDRRSVHDATENKIWPEPNLTAKHEPCHRLSNKTKFNENWCRVMIIR